MKSNVKKYRVRLGISQKKLADMVGIVPSQISKMEGDNPNPTIRTALKISEILGVPIHHLWKND